MMSEMKESDRHYQQTMARFAATMENLSQTVPSMVGMLGTSMLAPSPKISNWQHNNGGQHVLYGQVPNSSVSDQTAVHELGGLY